MLSNIDISNESSPLTLQYLEASMIGGFQGKPASRAEVLAAHQHVGEGVEVSPRSQLVGDITSSTTHCVKSWASRLDSTAGAVTALDAQPHACSMAC